jgi:hypothetical protein
VRPKLKLVSNNTNQQGKTHKIKDVHGNVFVLTTHQPTKELKHEAKIWSIEKLKTKYPKSYNSHRGLINRSKKGLCKVDSSIYDFRAFLLKVGICPTDLGSNEMYTLDRINPHDYLYKSDRVRWATKKQQAINKTSVTLFCYQGEKHTLKEWSKITGITYDTLRKRAGKGLADDELFNLTNAAAKTYWRRLLIYADPSSIEQSYRENRLGSGGCGFESRQAWLARCLRVELDTKEAAWINCINMNTSEIIPGRKTFVAKCEYMFALYEDLTQAYRIYSGKNILGNYFDSTRYLGKQPRLFYESIFNKLTVPEPKILIQKSPKIVYE